MLRRSVELQAIGERYRPSEIGGPRPPYLAWLLTQLSLVYNQASQVTNAAFTVLRECQYDRNY